MGKINRVLLMSLLSLIIILGANSVSAFVPEAFNITIVAPSTSSISSGNTNFTVNLHYIRANLQKDYIASFYLVSSSTANNTRNNGIILNAGSNYSAGALPGSTGSGYANFSINVTNAGLWLVEDANDYVFNVTIGNSTLNTSLIISALIVDFTTPDTPTDLLPADASVDSDGDVTFSATVLGSSTISCTLEFVSNNFGGPSQAMIHTGDSCSLSLTSVPAQSYQWFIRASDGSNTTNSAVFTSTIQTSSGKSIGEDLAKKIAEGDKGKIPPFVIIIVIIVIIGIIISKKK